jgi:uncharacterized protein YqkB
MNLLLLTWNSVSINNGSPFYSDFPPGSKVNIHGNTVTVPRAGNYPYLSGIVADPQALQIMVRIAAGQNIDTNRELLKQYFNYEDGQRHNLIAEDGSGGTQWYVTGFVRDVRNEGGNRNSFLVLFQIEYPYWKLVTATDTTWSVTASGQTQAITNAGNRKIGSKFTLTPTSGKAAGLTYRRWVPIYNNMDISYIAPLDITSGGLDTATLTTAKMQADGDDFRVWVDGVEVDRWLQDMDTATTKCWVNLNLGPRRQGTTDTSIAGAGAITTITFSKTKANLEFLHAMAAAVNKVVLIDSEAFIFTGVNLVTYQLTGVTRTKKDTTIAAHAQPKTVRWIEHDVWILYGDSTLTAPDVDDDNKPIFALSSTNGAWVFTNFYDADSARTGMWKGETLASRTGLSYVYTAADNTFVDPSTSMGIALIGSSDFQVQNETGTVAWSFSHPATITTVLFSGDKYNTGSWPAIAGLQYLKNNVAWFTSNNQAEPVIVETWEAFGPTTAAIVSPYPSAIRFVIDGLLSSVVSEMALIQFDTVTVTFNSSNLPTITVVAEAAAYYFDVTITNNTSTEYIKCAVPCFLNDVVTIDCETKDASLSDGGRVNITLSTDRAEWLDLSVGANTLQYDDTGTAAVTVHVIHRDRTL